MIRDTKSEGLDRWLIRLRRVLCLFLLICSQTDVDMCGLLEGLFAQRKRCDRQLLSFTFFFPNSFFSEKNKKNASFFFYLKKRLLLFFLRFTVSRPQNTVFKYPVLLLLFRRFVLSFFFFCRALERNRNTEQRQQRQKKCALKGD